MARFCFLAFVVFFALANDVLVEPVPGEPSFSPPQQALLDESVGTAIYEAATVLLCFAIVAVSARLLGFGQSTLTAKKKIRKSAKMASASAKPEVALPVSDDSMAKSPCSSTPMPKKNNTRSAAAARLPNERVAAATNFLAGAVNAGKAWNLPQLLDDSIHRLRQGAPVDPETARLQAAQLLLSSVRACASKRCFQEALAAHDHMARHIGEACGATWSLLLWSAVEAGDCVRGSRFAKKLRAVGELSQNDFVNLVRCAVYHKDMAQFIDILDECKESKTFQLEVLTRNRALAVLTSSLALDFAAEFVARTSHVPLDVIAYNTLMKGYAMADKPQLCLQLYRQMRSLMIQPSDVSFGILLDACVGGALFEDAKRVFDDLRSSGGAVNVVHYTTFIKGLVNAGCLSDARDVLMEMHVSPRTRPDVITYSTLAKAYADAGRVDDGIQLLEMMKKQGVEPDGILFNIILSSCGASPLKAEKISQVFNRIVGFGFVPTSSTFSVLIKACARSQCLDLALDFVRDAPNRFCIVPETRIYSQLAQACMTAGAHSLIIPIYSTMVEAFRGRGLQVDTATNMRFVRFCASCGIHLDAAAPAAAGFVQAN